MFEFKKLTYQDYLKMEPTFISLDISVSSTGWVKSVNGKLSWGTYTLKSESELDRRKEFKEFIAGLVDNIHYPYVFIEDVIAGTNFKTTKGLIQLNTIVDDLNMYGFISVGEIKRIDNKKWKKYLRLASNYEPEIKCEDDKKLICNCLNELDFCEKVAQDIYDALGIAVSIIYRDKILNLQSKTDTVLKMDLRRNYLLKQFGLNDSKIDKYISKLSEKYKREVESLDWSSEKRDVLYLFKQKIKSEDTDDFIYVIRVNNMKLGVLALTKKLNVEEKESIIIATKKR